MAGTITTGNHPKALWPGIYSWFGSSYAKHPKFCDMMFDIKTSKKAYEEIVENTGFGLAAKKAQGSSVLYDSASQGPTTRFTHDTYSLGYVVTEEAIEDNLYSQVSMSRAANLALSMYTTKEIVAANVFNRAFNNAYTGGNGVEMISTAQVTLDGTQSNHLTVAADFSEAALEDMVIQVKKAKNSRGLEIAVQTDKLIIPVELEFEATRVLKSTLQSGTANNDTNAVRQMGIISGGIVANPFLTDTDAWFVSTNVGDSLIGFQRRALKFEKDNDFSTSNALAKASERYVFNWGDWRGIFGSPGSA